MSETGIELGAPKREGELRQLLDEVTLERLVGRLERILDVHRWGFRLTYVKTRPPGRYIIYDSPRCRIMCSLSMERSTLPEEDAILVLYGRAHAANEGGPIEWQGGLCRAWHNLWEHMIRDFVEGHSAEEAAERYRKHAPWETRDAFNQTEPGQALKGADRSMAFDRYYWERYEEPLFSLFDIRRVDRWEAFRRYLREFYRLSPDHSNLNRPDDNIPPWNVC